MSGAPPAIEISELSKSFGSSLVLSSFSLSVAPGEIHALLGANGSGKSTLIKILSGFHVPDPGGDVRIHGERLVFGSPPDSYRLGGRFLHQDRGLVAELSVLDNLYLGGGFPTRGGTIRARATVEASRRMLAQVGLDVDPRAPLAELRAADRTGVALARAVRPDPTHPPRLLVLDEPTATLPVDEVDHLLSMVRATAHNGVAVLYVTHHLDEVFRLADAVTVLRDGRMEGTYPVAEVARRQLVELITGGELADIEAESRPTVSAAEPPALAVTDLWAPQIRGVSLQARPGEVLGLAGITGSGREALLGTIFGANRYERGTVSVKGRDLPAHRPDVATAAGMAFMPGDHRITGGIMSMSARENLTLADLRPFWSGLRMAKRKERTEAAKWFAVLDVRPSDGIENPLSTFSGGNQQKILFAKWMRRNPAVFLLDEPTEGVDVGAKRDLHRQLLSAASGGATVVVSSTDVEELEAICTRVLIMRNGRIVDELVGRAITSAEITHRVLSGAEHGQGQPRMAVQGK